MLFRQLQTRSVITPALARHVCPDIYESDVCSVCASARATLTHILWDCSRYPTEAAAPQGRLPDSIARAVASSDLTEQLQAVQQLEAALARRKPGVAPTEASRGHPRRPLARRTGGRLRGNASRTP